MASIRSLISQTAVYGVSTTLSKFLNYLLVPYLTRIMSEQVYGEYSYYYSIIPIANVLLTMGFATSYFRFAGAAGSLGEQKRLFSTLWGSVILFAILFCGIGSTIFPHPLSLLTLALIFVDNVSAIPQALLRQQGRAGYYTMVNVSGVLINIAFCFGFYHFIDGASRSASWGILANIIASSASLILLLPVAIKMVSRVWSWSVFRRVTLYSLPLLASGLMGVSSDFIDRQVLRWALPSGEGLVEVGIYASVGKIAALMMIFRQMYTLGAEPFFLQRFSKDDFSRLNASALKYFWVAGVFIFLVIMLFSDIFSLMIGTSFRIGMGVLPLLLFSNLLAGVLVNLSFWYKVADMTRIAIYVTMTGLSCSLLFNIILIPQWGYVGASWARVASMVVMVLLSYILGQKHYPVRYDLRSIGFYALLGIIIYMISLTTASMFGCWRWSANFLLLLGFIVIFIRKERIKWRPKSES